MKWLILSPHYDDAEIACGATIAHAKDYRSTDIKVLVFAAQRRLDESPFGTLQEELLESSEVLEFDYEEQGFESRTLWEHRQEVLDILYREEKNWNPDIVLAPSLNETHQDHQVLAEEAFRAFKFSNLVAYDLPWNIRKESVKTMFCEVTERDIKKKIEAVACYKSQQPRDYLSEEAIRALAKARGLQCGKPYAEAFEVYRWFLC
jgi:LmbE family N-acetylglucosaminyl deacetylase